MTICSPQNKSIYLISIVFFCVILTHAQQVFNVEKDSISETKQFAFKTLTIHDGLSQNSVISIAQDSIGYLWLATQDGLNKYDGRNFTHYNKQFEDITRATFSKLGKIYIDKQNRLWIISHSGKLERYHPETDDFSSINMPSHVNSIFQDNALNFYIGRYNNGLLKINAETKDTISIFKNKHKFKTVYDYLEVDNTLLVATSGAVFQISEDNSFKIIKNDSLINFSTLDQDKNGIIWLGSYGDGLYFKKKNDNNFSRYNHPNLPKNINIEDILVDSKNRLWLATYGHGVFLIEDTLKNVTNFMANKNNPFAIHYNDILSIYEDASGIIWFGSDGTGVSYYDEHLIKFNILTNNQVPKSINVDMVRSITTDTKNNIWIGTSGKGLTRYNVISKKYKSYTVKNAALASDRVISLNFNADDLWIGHQGYGLNILESSGDIQFYPELATYTIWHIANAGINQMWLCTEAHGLLLFDKTIGILKIFNTENSNLKTNNIRTLAEDQNHLWIGTGDDGVFKLNKNTDKITKVKKLNSKIKSLYVSKNTLWIGTNGDGLKKYNITQNTVKTFTIKNGLPNDVVYSILPHLQEQLWLSTNNGLSKLSLNTQEEHFENFSIYDGLQGKEFNTGAAFKDTKGFLYFGGLEGINWFHPSKLTYNTTKPKTIITNFDVFLKAQPLKQNTTLKHDQNTVTFTFSSLHFSQPERNLYEYQLVNHDADWISSGNNNMAHYTNLPPNTYTFKVISCSYDGIWNKTPATFTFTINQPWYFSTVAKLCYVLLFLLISYGIYAYLKWRWHLKMQLQFEHQETNRLKKLNHFKTKLYTNLSHEFRTPLTLITGPIENQLNNPDLPEQAKKELKMVQRNSDRLLNLVNQLLDLSKLESGNLNLSVTNGNLNLLLKQLVYAFKFKAKEKNINYSYQLQPIEDAWFDADVIEKIVTNLLANAIKYTPEQGEIHFETNLQSGQLILTVINNGNTLTDYKIRKLFERYYQDNKTSDGVGIGLSLVKELCILSHGNIVAHTMNTDDIQFTVTLPIERSFFNTSEIKDTKPLTKPIIKPAEIILPEKKQTTTKPILLIIEDEDDIRQYIKSIFEKDYIIKEAINGEIGIKKAIKLIPDIIISDVMMPVLDGIQLCNTLKTDARTNHIPLILLTAKGGNKNEIEGLEMGADDYILKPFNSEKLKIRVRKLIELRLQLQKKYTESLEIKHLITTSTDEHFFNSLKETLDKHLTKPDFNAHLLSEKMLMSRMQLHRKMKALTNLSTTEFIRIERLKLSKAILDKHPNAYTVAEIAYNVGFNSPSYFSKCFKDMYHCTPLDYTKKLNIL
ncbi:two-component regulator propeller domain-containing protein [Algibacter miyuki]|uniref:histidine kinase n=1 Tax=Algibacter miyuki TaxID=1306933 RepID=A0ABV5GZB8_9FLAO|nr:two-component regulator propeller domain-containing protein [Algibacter miyuki]MDN3666815.1 two-component regulator propeller domain-containing protein [Algibacter miyuki]